jgi:hypothetical protein
MQVVIALFTAYTTLRDEFDEYTEQNDVIDEMRKVIDAVCHRLKALSTKLETQADMILRRADLMNDLQSRLQECRVCLYQTKNPTKLDWLTTFKDRNKKIRVATNKLKDTNDRLTAFNVDHVREWVDRQHGHTDMLGDCAAAPNHGSTGLFSCLAFRPAPVLTEQQDGSAQTGATVFLRKVERGIRAELDAAQLRTQYRDPYTPICISSFDGVDGVFSEVGVKSHGCRVQVLSALGFGWEPEDTRAGEQSPSLTCTTVDAVVDRLSSCGDNLPRIVVLCLKYGAKTAAKQLQERSGIETVVWVATDMASWTSYPGTADGSPFYVNVVRPLVDAVVTSEPKSQDIAAGVIARALETCSQRTGKRVVGGVCTSGCASCLQWRPANRPAVECRAQLLVPTNIGDAADPQLYLRSQDIVDVAKVKDTLTEEGRTVLKIWNKRTGAASRSSEEVRRRWCHRARAVAYCVCHAQLSTGAFTAVRRVTSAAEGESLLADGGLAFGKARSVCEQPRPLLWVDMVADTAIRGTLVGTNATSTQGTLEQKGHGLFQRWKFRRVEFDCESMQLRYFDDDKAMCEGRVVSYANVENRDGKRQHRFDIKVESAAGVSVLLAVKAESAEEKARWMSVLHAALDNTPERWTAFIRRVFAGDVPVQRPLVLLTSDWENWKLMQAVSTALGTASPSSSALALFVHDIGKGGAGDTEDPPEHRASLLHDEFKFHVSHPDHGWGQLLELTGAQALKAGLEVVLRRPIAGMYTDDDGGVMVRVNISDVAYIHELRDRVLNGEVGQSLTKQLASLGKLEAGWEVSADLTQFAEMYESSILSLDYLTEHQRQKMQECLDTTANVQITAPAGAGKTFVALHMMQQLLESDTKAHVLFVARNKALPCFVAAWLSKRMTGTENCEEVLERLHVLFQPFEDGPRGVRWEAGKMVLEHLSSSFHYDLLVVDEAHHVYGGGDELRSNIEACVTGKTRRLLLSDASQASNPAVADRYPTGMEIVELTEVVRSTKRIVAGAMAFQRGATEALMQCHHESAGPPLKSFLFSAASEVFEQYAQQTFQAIVHVMRMFKALSMHHRLAILVPDEAFLAAFRGPLTQALVAHDWKLVNAEYSFAAGISYGARGTSDQDSTEVVFDTVANFDGLERLIVIAVGLDSPIDSSGRGTTEACSRLYRAITRADMMVVVVNELLRGGWLEWLTRVEFDKAGSLDREVELARLNKEEVARVTTVAVVTPASREALVPPQPEEEEEEVEEEEEEEEEEKEEEKSDALGGKRGGVIAQPIPEASAASAPPAPDVLLGDAGVTIAAEEHEESGSLVGERGAFDTAQQIATDPELAAVFLPSTATSGSTRLPSEASRDSPALAEDGGAEVAESTEARDASARPTPSALFRNAGVAIASEEQAVGELDVLNTAQQITTDPELVAILPEAEAEPKFQVAPAIPQPIWDTSSNCAAGSASSLAFMPMRSAAGTLLTNVANYRSAADITAQVAAQAAVAEAGRTQADDSSPSGPITRREPPRNKEAKRCYDCLKNFGLFDRHHCRNCGNSCCQECSQFTRDIPQFGLQVVRVCGPCAFNLGPELQSQTFLIDGSDTGYHTGDEDHPVWGEDHPACFVTGVASVSDRTSKYATYLKADEEWQQEMQLQQGLATYLKADEEARQEMQLLMLHHIPSHELLESNRPAVKGRRGEVSFHRWKEQEVAIKWRQSQVCMHSHSSHSAHHSPLTHPCGAASFRTCLPGS